MKLKSFSEFLTESFRGGAMQTYNDCHECSSLENARKKLKDLGISWDNELTTINGTIEFRKKSKTFNTGDGSVSIAMFNPSNNTLYTDGYEQEKLDEGGIVGTVNAPVYDESPERFPEIAVEKDEKYYKYMKEIANLLRELYTTALENECDPHRVKEALFPKYKSTKNKIHVTEDGDLRFDSFGRYPDISINLKNMKKGNHTTETIKEEIKENLKKLEERMPGMPSQSAISSFQS